MDLDRGDALAAIRTVAPDASLGDFDVSTDSVVVTVRLATTKRARRIVLDWGDDEQDTLLVPPGLSGPTGTHEQDDPLPVGTYEFRHAYDLPTDELPFTRTFLLHVESADGSDDLRLKTVRLVPRFVITQYRAYLYLQEPCDLANSSSELRIKQVVGDRIREWRWEPNSSFYPVSTVLEGSQFSVEVTTEADATSDLYTPMIPVRFEIRELDPGPNQYGSHSNWIYNYGVTARNSEDVDRTVKVEKDFGSCNVRLRYDREVKLVRRLAPPGSDWPVFVPADS